MKRIIAALAIVLALSVSALAQPRPDFTATYSLAANANPSGICTYEVRFWINNVTNDMFSCYQGTWHPVGGAAAAAFPITDVDGASSVTLSGDATAETGSFLLANATDVAGMNAALGGTLGASLFASNATGGVTLNADMSGANPTLTIQSTLGTDYSARSFVETFSGGGFGQLLAENLSTGVNAYVQTQVNNDNANQEFYASSINGYVAGAVSNAGSGSSNWEAVSQHNSDEVTIGVNVDRGAFDRTVGSQPTCNASVRRSRWYVEGGAGVADTYEVCMKSSLDTYAWVVIAVNP